MQNVLNMAFATGLLYDVVQLVWFIGSWLDVTLGVAG